WGPLDQDVAGRPGREHLVAVTHRSSTVRIAFEEIASGTVIIRAPDLHAPAVKDLDMQISFYTIALRNDLQVIVQTISVRGHRVIDFYITRRIHRSDRTGRTAW